MSLPQGTLTHEEVVRYLERAMQRNLVRETTIIAFALGCIFTLGVVLMAHSVLYTGSAAEFAFGMHVIVVHVAFHLSEFLCAVSLRPHEAHPGAFMLWHSNAYVAANVLSLIEFVAEVWWVPESWKLSVVAHPYLGSVFRLNCFATSVFGVLVAITYGVRVVGMIQCGANFSLQIEWSKREDHQLVTHGVYRVLRHPAYFGWFWRTLFAQLMVANPICTVAHTAVTWWFFHERIPEEEEAMAEEDYFGREYVEYMARTHVGIPFIPSLKVTHAHSE